MQSKKELETKGKSYQKKKFDVLSALIITCFKLVFFLFKLCFSFRYSGSPLFCCLFATLFR